ncbi:MAG: hypothetical protein RMK91_06485 [Pseudanabaenaceae cyanobacterium SKYGB_i_bin29]|nr:hypothetical protein [Pseudanabaenaceae cyanobacterium SKYG29]MDW8421499.1 hypothetical protein [Pseudanabaenaceae cyanobacterium SKYGB_i_bin29]
MAVKGVIWRWGLVLLYALPGMGQTLLLSRNFRPDPLQMSGRAGGDVSLAVLAGSASGCRGFAQSEPNHLLTVTESFPLLDMVALTRDVNQDLTMLVKGPGGMVWCGDDEYRGRSPRVSARLAKGIYQVWVGTGEQGRSVDYTLSISETPHK